MRRRRFFRVLTLTLLLLCVGAWGWSYSNNAQLGYTGERQYWIDLRAGKLTVASSDVIFRPGLFCGSQRGSQDLLDGSPGQRMLGFHFISQTIMNARFLRVPLWFPTLLLTALTAWAWRKWRSEGERGFAVGQEQLREESGEKRDH